MKSISFFVFLFFALPSLAIPGDHHKGGWYGHHEHDCLTDYDATCIVDKWISIRSTDPSTAAYAALVDETFTDDVTLEDETVSFFFFFDKEGPYSTGKIELTSNYNFSWTTAISKPLVPAAQIPIRHDCDSITFRWVVTATVNLIAPYSTAKIGDPIHYKGTDLLVLAPGSHLIQHVYSSSDLARAAWQLGEKVCFQRGAPKPVCADVVPPALCFSPTCQ